MRQATTAGIAGYAGFIRTLTQPGLPMPGLHADVTLCLAPLVKAWLRWGCAVLLTAGCRDPEGGGNAVDTDTDTTTDTTTVGADDTTGDTTGDTTDDDGELDPSAIPEPMAGRLTDVQYRYSVLDVLGATLTEDEIDDLPRDIPTGRDYSTTVQPQFFNANYVLAYADIARSVTARLDLGALVLEFGDCKEIEPSCRPAFVEGLGLRMFRRPLTEDEITRYLDLADAIASAAETDEGHVVHGIVQAMMQAPQFLYRIERETEGEPGSLRRIDGYEMASRLSYFLWQSAPDETLLAFAAGPEGDGTFDPDAVGEQIERMLFDSRFARARTLFWGDYTLAVRSNFGTNDAQLAGELRDSLLMTVERISGAQGDAEPLSALFDGQEIVMTPAVAEIAGAASNGEGLQVYDVADGVERLGVVTHPAFLASIGTTSFVGRGLFLSERLVCQHVSEPPLEVEEEIENTAQATENMTPREASEFRFGLEPVCLGCHTQFEPIAYAFERYDITGRYTPTDEQGRDLFSDGVLPPFSGRPEIAFDDASQLLSSLAGLEAVHACLVENMTEFGTGLQANQAGDFHDIATADFIDEGLTFDALARAVASSEQRTFMRVVEP